MYLSARKATVRVDPIEAGTSSIALSYSNLDSFSPFSSLIVLFHSSLQQKLSKNCACAFDSLVKFVYSWVNLVELFLPISSSIVTRVAAAAITTTNARTSQSVPLANTNGTWQRCLPLYN